MRKQVILGIAIATAFVIGVLSANPVVDAAGGWKEALGLHEGDSSAHHDVPETQVYEVSGVSVIPQGADRGNEILLPCLEGDWFLAGSPLFSITTEPSIIGEGIRLTVTSDPIVEGDSNSLTGVSKIVAFAVTPVYIDIGAGDVAPFEITTTITSVCISPS